MSFPEIPVHMIMKKFLYACLVAGVRLGLHANDHLKF
jgi:hypothetical protein